MSFTHYKKTIEDGDTVILFLGFDNMLQFTVDRNRTHQTKYGALRHKDIIGKPFGSKVQCSKGYAHILHPTPELWTLNLPHRTQILYSTDISLIILQLDLRPGAVVVESGTGSGSLSHALMRAIMPGGFLHTFDFHEERVEKARKEFEDHGFGDSVKVTHRDVLVDGFELENVADAVFLDLPAPWDAISHAKKAMKIKGGRLCSFSPCIEQVQRACEELRKLGFTEIQTYECLSRTFDVRTINMPMPDLGFPSETSDKSNPGKNGDSFHHPVIGQICSGEEANQHRGKRLRGQHQFKRGQHDKGLAGKEDRSKESGKKSDNVSNVKDTKNEADEVPSKKAKNDDINEEPGNSENKERFDDLEKDANDKETDSTEKKTFFDKSSAYLFKSGVAPHQMPGHTGYLTFATLLPSV